MNIFKDNELSEKSNVQKMHVDNVKQLVDFFDLDVILAVGYRVNSRKSIIF